MSHPTLRIGRLAALALAAALAVPALAADEPEAPPTKLEFDFGVDLYGAGFFNQDSWFGESDAFLGDNTDQWLEFAVEPKIKFQAPLGRGVAFGELSGVWSATAGEDASGLTIGVEDASEVTLEQGYFGWKASDLFPKLAGDELSISVGSQDYRIGSGLLIADGTNDGGERGGWYLSARKSFQESILVKLDTDDFKFEGFRLVNRPRQGGVQGEALGMNFEAPFGAASRAGLTLMSVDSYAPGTDEASVISARYDLAPEKGFGASAEFVKETSDQIDANGWFAQLSYATDGMAWSPTFFYRYATFTGDDPTTPEDERFREIAYGYTDYGSWYQGEITGNYPLGNGNLESHLLRMKVTPSDTLTMNLLYYKFTFNEPASFGLTSDDWGDEVNLTLDWAYSDRLYLIGVLGVLVPGDAAVQMVGGDQDWVYTMVYASYAWSN